MERESFTQVPSALLLVKEKNNPTETLKSTGALE
jgi:hypothetical protein